MTVVIGLTRDVGICRHGARLLVVVGDVVHQYVAQVSKSRPFLFRSCIGTIIYGADRDRNRAPDDKHSRRRKCLVGVTR